MIAEFGAALAAFALAMAGIWWWGRRNLVHLREQEIQFARFEAGVRQLRTRTDIPAPIRDFVEQLVRLPLNAVLAKGALVDALKRPPVKSASPALVGALDDLPDDAAPALLETLLAYSEVIAHSHWFFGPLYRRSRMLGLSSQTQTRVLMEDVTRSWRTAAHA